MWSGNGLAPGRSPSLLTFFFFVARQDGFQFPAGGFVLDRFGFLRIGGPIVELAVFVELPAVVESVAIGFRDALFVMPRARVIPSVDPFAGLAFLAEQLGSSMARAGPEQLVILLPAQSGPASRWLSTCK